MTNILLSIIAVLLLARIVLQVRQGKRAVENKIVFHANNSETTYNAEVENYNKLGYELIQIVPYITAGGNGIGDTPKDGCLLLFTRKKIKNYYEE